MTPAGEPHFQAFALQIAAAAKKATRAAGENGVMFFLLRTAFWLSIVLALLPGGGSTGADSSNASSFDAAQAVSAAGAAVTDMSSFCSRQPHACEAGAQAAIAFGQRAQAGARRVYDLLTEKTPSSTTGSVRNAPKTAVPDTDKVSQHTLKPADLQPAWRSPAPRRNKEAASKHPA
jgi:hypothetical protein